MPVNARRLVRKMRGGAQAHLIEADDGRFYVVKFSNNPQHRRILLNEMVASALLRHLQISAPETAVIQITPEFLAEQTDVYMQLGDRRLAVEPGWHFGSCYPGDPNRVAVYDFVPDTLLDTTANLADFLGVLVFDKWLSNADARQSVFLRARLREYAPVYADHPKKLGFVALMIDHGFLFDGPHWRFSDSPIQGLYLRPSVYRSVKGYEDFQPWLDRVLYFPEDVIDAALKAIPIEWIQEDGDALQGLLEKAMNRRKRVPDLLRECSRGRTDPFPAWQSR